MSIPDFYGTLNKFTQEIDLGKIEWQKRPSQYVTAQTYEEAEARKISRVMVQALNINEGKEVVGTVQSSSGGTRVIIWDVPRFTKALQVYEENRDRLTIEKMKGRLARVAVYYETKALYKEREKEVKEAEELLRKLCANSWSKEDMIAGNLLEQKFSCLSPSCSVVIHQESSLKGDYVIRTRSLYLLAEPVGVKYYNETSVSYDDIKFILQTLKR